ncbi:hypothetical protein [Rubripirellula reticaptiva]|uniref:Uncharacterized protein n=1 Tax=Rubripirellula reticaptiva TaxID=2528013 RepID=A0A5C6EI89_9BACT|nr:hypothetical protein [Rubripirellula reticaptiva]TWU48214.1 hypothetical protein Poly59_50600 [Rubripirellula reticaptiva]
MPVEQPPSVPPQPSQVARDRVPPWAVPIGSLGGMQLNLSYGIFVAAGIVLTVVMIAKSQPGNSDLPKAALLGTMVWVSGWVVQSIVHTFTVLGCGLSVGELTVGLIGVETSPRRWPPKRALVVTLSTMGSLVVLAMVFRLIGGGFQIPTLSDDSAGSLVTGLFAMPSLGMAAPDAMWKAAAWLCSLQAVCQIFPLPRSLGRQTYGALTAICGTRLDLPAQVRVFRRCLIVLAMLTMVLAMWSLAQTTSTGLPSWPILFGLALLLWVSSYRSDIVQILRAFEFSTEAGSSQSRRQPSLVAKVKERLNRKRKLKRLKAVMQQERNEAVDAARLDDILRRLHSGGKESLSAEDQKILARVSDQLRKNRSTGNTSSGS